MAEGTKSLRKSAETGPKHKVEKTEKGPIGKALENPWILLVLIIGLIALALFGLNLLSTFLSGS